MGTRTAPAAAHRAREGSWAGEPALSQWPVEKFLGAADTQQSDRGISTLSDSMCSANSFFAVSLTAGPQRGRGTSPSALLTTPLPSTASLCSPSTCLSELVAFFRHSALTSLQKAAHALTLLLSCPLIKTKLYLMHTAYFTAKATCFPALLSGAFVAEAIYLSC